MLSLSTRKVRAGKDEVTKSPTLEQRAWFSCKTITLMLCWVCLFFRQLTQEMHWQSLSMQACLTGFVEEINLSLSMGKDDMGHSVSILDFYGFESFKKNSFGQVCINYANERLQQHCNRHLVKLEQEYELDGIDWKKVDFEDNLDCLDLFEKKPTGLISVLDEVSDLPKATYLIFTAKLKQHLNTNRCFKGEKGGTFSICHYDGETSDGSGDGLPLVASSRRCNPIAQIRSSSLF
ncbi:myosin 2 [Perilla frutescens var. hirtella]|nr:myosin 2 [Perilla frutescens var. hirtella]